MAQANPAGPVPPIVAVDTAILSMFAKVEALTVLGQLLGQERLATTPAIREEIAVPLQYGYDFPLQALAHTAIAPLTNQVWPEHERLRALGASLGRGELEAIAFCKIEGALFATNDLIARRFALEQGVHVISLQTILRGLWVTGVCSKSEVRELLERIKRADRLEVPSEVETEIFSEEAPS